MREATPRSGRGRAILLQAAVTGLALQCLRVLFPMVYGVYERGGAAPAAALAAGVFAAPLLCIALPRGRSGTWTAVGLAVAGRLAVQVVRPTPLWLAALAAAAALIALARSLEVPGSHPATGIALGVALDAATLAGFATWDPAFRDSVAALTAAVVWSCAAVWGLAGVDDTTAGLSAGWAIGPALALDVLFLANPAAVASRTALGPAAAALVTLAGCAVAVAATSTPRRGIVTAIAGLALITGGATIGATLGGGAVPLVLAVQAGWGIALSAALSGDTGRTARSWPIGVALGMLIFAAVLFAYQLDVEQPLPVPRWILPATAGLILTGAALRSPLRGSRDRRAPLRWVALPVALPVALLAAAALGIPLALAASTSTPAPELPVRASEIRVLDWNVHGGVDAEGRVDPAAVAETIAAQQPDVVVLQEVARGWPIHGDIDLAAWLGVELGMPYRWAPAADGQFGNVVLSRLPILGSRSLMLPYGGGPEHRSALRVTLDAGGGRTLTVIGLHLQDRAGSDVDRVQAATVVRTWDPVHATVVAGDLNAQPGEPAVRTLSESGLVSAQDAAGDPAASTARDPLVPGDRVDWIFVTPDLSIASFRVVAGDASDHLPLVVAIGLA